MEIYVGARFGRKEEVRRVQELVRGSGHAITADWTQHRSIKPYDIHQDEAAEFAQEDIDGVVGAEVCLFLVDGQESTGVYTELGAAIASNKLTGKPKIFVVGESPALFVYHPAVNRRNSVEEVMKEMEA
jgi:nucleoside 2-deoxyribosyltransferase